VSGVEEVSALTEQPDPPTNPERTVDELEREVLAGRPESESVPDRDAATDEPAFEQDKDVEDIPGGAGEPGGHADEPVD
jgi:hypothetical protein